MTQLFLSPFTLLLVIGLMFLGTMCHMYNIKTICRKLSFLTSEQISRNSLLEELSQAQGSNFNAAATSAWSLLFVTITYFYFLTPKMFDINYFRIPYLASSPLGFFLLGILVILTIGVIAAYLPRIYSCYDISRMTKKTIIATIPLLGVSLFCSAYAGTMYPQNASTLIELAALMMILISEVILLSPFIIGAAEVAR